MQQRRAAGAGPVWPSLAAQGAAHAGLKPWVAHSAAGGDKRREKADGAMRGRYTRSRVAENHPASGPRLLGVRSSLTWSPVLAYLASGPRLPGVRSSLTWSLASGPRSHGVRSSPKRHHLATWPEKRRAASLTPVLQRSRPKDTPGFTQAVARSHDRHAAAWRAMRTDLLLGLVEYLRFAHHVVQIRLVLVHLLQRNLNTPKQRRITPSRNQRSK